MSAAEALAPERSVDEVRESLSVTEKGQPANTIGNCRTVFCHDPLLRLSLIHIFPDFIHPFDHKHLCISQLVLWLSLIHI